MIPPSSTLLLRGCSSLPPLIPGIFDSRLIRAMKAWENVYSSKFKCVIQTLDFELILGGR